MRLDEIEAEIRRLEKAEANYTICEKLAVMYAVRDGLKPKEEPRLDRYSYAYSNASTEFGMAFSKCEPEAALGVLEEHFEAVKAIYPKEYELVLKQLKNG